MNFREPNILFLKGISLKDIIDIEDIYQNEILTNLNPQITEKVVYDIIPKQFTDLKSWKKNTNIRCWFCTLIFKNIPWFLIENTNYTSDGIIYDIIGNFCSVGCLQGYVNIHYNKRIDFDIYNSVKKVYEIFYNKKINEIEPSPNKYNLKIYGGNLEIHEYQNEIQKINQININSGYLIKKN